MRIRQKPAQRVKGWYMYIIDLSDSDIWIIRKTSHFGDDDIRYLAGTDKAKVQTLIARLNEHGRALVRVVNCQLLVCWNNHQPHTPCQFVVEIASVYG